MEEIKSLGAILKEAREVSKFSLRDVEEVTKISNAYISQLENDKIKNPSANYLYKLANLYGIEFESLLNRAGIIQEKTGSDNRKNISSSALYSSNLSAEEENELIKYLTFLRYNQKKKKK